jgi:hypothetical protein
LVDARVDTGGTLLRTEALPNEIGVSMIPFSLAIFSGDGTRVCTSTGSRRASEARRASWSSSSEAR